VNGCRLQSSREMFSHQIAVEEKEVLENPEVDME
jgi:hypothetical protein